MIEPASRFLQDLAIVLSAAAFATIVFQRFRWPVVPGYLLAGVLLGPAFASRLITDVATVRTLAELGVVMLMLAVGLEFRVRRVARLGARVGLVAITEIGLMLAMGYGLGRLLGWTQVESFLAAGVVAISSTAVIAKTFDDGPVDRPLKDLVFGVLVLEDVVAIGLVAVATTVAFGQAADLATVGAVLGRLALLLVGLVVGGMLLVPGVIRMVVALGRRETTLVTAMGLTFLIAWLTHATGFSVALGGFAAGALMAESGVGHHVEEVIKPVRDLFAAIFFVAVGMLLDVGAALASFEVVVLFAVVVIGGKVGSVALGSFLSGFGTKASVQAGLTMSQVGEFAFVIAGLGLARGADGAPLYPVAVATAMITAWTSTALTRRSERIAAWVDRRLPAPLQTVATLYGAWLEDLSVRRGVAGPRQQVRRLVGWLVFDGAIMAALLIMTSVLYRTGLDQLAAFGLAPAAGRIAILVGGALLALPFGFGLVLAGRRLAGFLAETVVPAVRQGRVDQGRAPRRTLLVTLEIAIVLAVGIPIVVVTLPFLPPFGAPGLIGVVLLLLALSFWRTARDLDSHTRAGAELVAHVLGRRGAADTLDQVRDMLPGLGDFAPLVVDPASPAVGRTLGELNLRGLTGATIVALTRGADRIAYPRAKERLLPGDAIALTGTHEAVGRAVALLTPLKKPSAAAPSDDHRA